MTQKNDSLRVAIAGAGSIAFASAALLHELGHIPVLWSPSGAATKAFEDGTKLTATGAVESTFVPLVAKSAKDLVAGADAVMIAVPAYAHKGVMDAIAPFVGPQQAIVISSHASFGALYMSRLLAGRGIQALIIAWGSTIVTGRKTGPAEVGVNTIREKIDIATVPHERAAEGAKICRALFGEHFVGREGLMAIALSNLNPQNHMGIALCNMTRMEHAEVWSQALNVTPGVGRLLEALDTERLAIASALQVPVRDIFEHFSLSFHVPRDTISNMNKTMAGQGRGGFGPVTPNSRYVLEDVPYGLVPTAHLGRLAGQPAPLHEAGIKIFGALYGIDFEAENDLMAALDIANMPLDRLLEFSRQGARVGDYAKRPDENERLSYAAQS